MVSEPYFHRVSWTCHCSQFAPCDQRGLLGLDLRQLRSADKRVGLVQKTPSSSLVVVSAVVSLSVTVGGTEVVTTSEG